MAGRLVLVSYAFHLIDNSTNLLPNHVDARGHLSKRTVPIDIFCIQKDEAVHSNSVG